MRRMSLVTRSLLGLAAASIPFGIAAVPAWAGVETRTVVGDTFESGSLSADWDTIHGTTVVSSPGGAGGGSDYYARIANVATNQGGLGASFADLFLDPFATDFSIALDFRVGSSNRQFNLHVSAVTTAPSVGSATINLRIEGGAWAAYTTAWNNIALGSVTANTWNHLVLTGHDWGTGAAGTAKYDLAFTNHLGVTTNVTGLQYYQNGNPSTGGARSFNLNDAYGNNPGFDVDNVLVTATGAVETPATPVEPFARSGIYPHLAVANGNGSESGIGSVMNWGGKLWYMTYPAHAPTGSTDELYSIDSTLTRVTHSQYPGGTDANRYVDSAAGRMFIGSAIVDTAGQVSVLPVKNAGELRGRLTGTGPSLAGGNKVYYMTMEEGFYEVDLANPAAPVITTLRADGNVGGSANLPGVHGKGFYVGQDHVFFSNNGNGGCLAEWNGAGDPAVAASWKIIDNNKYSEITTRNGPGGTDPHSTDPVWALGWDDASVLLNMRDAATGQWTRYRLPKGSYTHDNPGGWYTEWPRIRDVGLGGGDYLMNEHGLMYRFPAGFSPSNTAGITPFATFHKMIVDYAEWNGQVVMAANDCSPFDNPLAGHPNSNLAFIDKSDLPQYGGRPQGAGGVWVGDSIAANTPSEAFLINGFENRVIHLSHRNSGPVAFTIELGDGSGGWTAYKSVTVGGSGYGYEIIPPGVDAQWVRVKADQSVASATAYLHLAAPQAPADAAMTRSLAKADSAGPMSQGVLLTADTASFPLQFAADLLDSAGQVTQQKFYRAQLNDQLQLEVVAVNDPAAASTVRTTAATTQDFGVDAASAFIDSGGTRYRLPMGDSVFSDPTASGWRRGKREIVTERALMNIHGTFYELPRDDAGGMRRIRPITTHNLQIFDFASWRGMLVLSGNLAGAAADDHYVSSDDGLAGLWFGNVDDLWKFGAPAGVGGPWNNTLASAGTPSDPYLMYGYDRKTLDLSHLGDSDVTFTLQVDVLGDGTWETFGSFAVAPGQTYHYAFEEGYSAHWIRFVSDTDVAATAWLTYSAVPEPATLTLLACAMLALGRRRR